MRHFARFGVPCSSYLMVEMAIVGNALPTMFLIFLYSDSLMHVHAGRSANPSDSSSYALDHIDLSSGFRDIILMSVGGDRFCSDAADTWRATELWNC